MLGCMSDPYSRAEYRRLIAWGPRIEREKPFLLDLMAMAPDRSVLDVGCGSGEHTAFFSGQGCRAVGVDRSEAMIEQARDHERKGHGRFILADASSMTEALGREPRFGLALCLGNMLPHVTTQAELATLLSEVASLLLPEGLLVIQILNYRRIREQGIRSLPVNLRAGDREGEEIVFLRVMTPCPDGMILFYPITLTLRGEAEEPVQVHSARRVVLRGWEDGELTTAFERAGFSVELRGGMTGEPYDPQESSDLVMIGRSRGGAPLSS